MAPEQWGDRPPDPRSDVFTTGSLLFEMLTGSPAFAGDDLVQVYHSIMSSHPPPLAGSAVTAAVDVVIHRALEKRPDDRYPIGRRDGAGAAVRGHAGQHRHAASQSPVRATTRLIALAVPDAAPGSRSRFPVVQPSGRGGELTGRTPVARRPLDACRCQVRERRRPSISRRSPPSSAWTRCSPARCCAPAIRSA